MKTVVNKLNLLILTGLLVVIAGVLTFKAEGDLFATMIKSVGALHIVAGAIEVYFATVNKQLKVGFWLFLLQGIAKIGFGVYVLTGVNTLEDFTLVTAVFAIFFAMFNIVFGLAAATLGKFSIKFLVVLLVSGVVSGITGIVLLAGEAQNTNYLKFMAVIMLVGGLSNITFAMRLRRIAIVDGIAQ